MDLRGINATNYNIIQSQLTVKTDPLGPSVALITSNEFKVEASIQNLKVDYALGYFGNQIVSDTSSLQFRTWIILLLAYLICHPLIYKWRLKME